MRKFFRFVLLGLVLLMVALVSALTAMRLAIHGREVEVPKLVGLSPEAARDAANESGLVVQVESRFYSADVSEGRVLSQLPPPGTQVRRGYRIRLAVSLGAQRGSVPNVVGQSRRAAEINIARRGLELGNVAVAQLPGLPPGQVVAQSPPPQAEGATSPKISLLVNAPGEEQAFVMPDLVGRQLPQVSEMLQRSGMRIGSVMEMDAAGAPAGVVLRHYPAAGQKITRAWSVSLHVARAAAAAPDAGTTPQPAAPPPTR
jgi:beta-lactam-binding protein with PASTA domain